jgi:hypothetical protein
MLTVLVIALSFLPKLVPQSPQAWGYAVTEGRQLIGTVYQKTPRGLVCAKPSQLEVVYTLESVAAREGEHPSRLAEEILVYLWDDWTLLHVSGYNTRAILERMADRPLLEKFLERFYEEHHTCLLGVLRVLVFGYQKLYAFHDGNYVRSREALGERYEPLALEPRYFPGTGIFEPLGLVYAVKLSDFFLIGWLREKAIDLVIETLQRRAQMGDDPLKVGRE